MHQLSEKVVLCRQFLLLLIIVCEVQGSQSTGVVTGSGGGPTDAEIVQILSIHNAFRSSVGASDMNELVSASDCNKISENNEKLNS